MSSYPSVVTWGSWASSHFATNSAKAQGESENEVARGRGREEDLAAPGSRDVPEGRDVLEKGQGVEGRGGGEVAESVGGCLLVSCGSFFQWPTARKRGDAATVMRRPSRVPPSMLVWCSERNGGAADHARQPAQDQGGTAITRALSSPTAATNDLCYEAGDKPGGDFNAQFKRTSSVGERGQM